MNNPYQVPMMNNSYMQPQNPYMDRMNFLQNYQQSLQQQPMQMEDLRLKDTEHTAEDMKSHLICTCTQKQSI